MSSTLVAFFSASGITAKVAQKLASSIDAELFEIKPEIPYTDADLDWINNKSRSSIEMADKSSRPRIASDCMITDIGRYKTIFIGFPIWWYNAPTIINTFLEQYDLKGKNIVLFATSGSSGMGNISTGLMTSYNGIRILDSKRFLPEVSGSELKEWAEKFI